MADSMAKKLAAPNDSIVRLGSDLYAKSDARAVGLGIEGGPLEPPARGGLLCFDVEHLSAARDPDVVLKSLVGCGLDVQLAASLLHDFYQVKLQSAEVISSSDLASENHSQSTAISSRASKYCKWREEAVALPEEPGCCYLQLVPFARRKHIKKALGSCPRVQDFISVLTPKDLDYDVLQRVNVYRVRPEPGTTLIKYHFAYSCDAADFVGTSGAFIAAILRLYPWLNAQKFDIDDQSLTSLPMAGVVGILPRRVSRTLSVGNAVVRIGHSPSDCPSGLDDVNLGRRAGVSHDRLEMPLSFAGAMGNITSSELGSRVGAESVHVLAECGMRSSSPIPSLIAGALTPVRSDCADSVTPLISTPGFTVTVAVVPEVRNHESAHATLRGMCVRIFQSSDGALSVLRVSDDVSEYQRVQASLLSRSQFVDGVVTSAVRGTSTQVHITVDATEGLSSFAWNLIVDSDLLRVACGGAVNLNQHSHGWLPAVADTMFPVYILTRLVQRYVTTRLVPWEILRGFRCLSGINFVM